MLNKKYRFITLVILLIVLLGLVWNSKQDKNIAVDQPINTKHSNISSHKITQNIVSAKQRVDFTIGFNEPSVSQIGTELDGALNIDENGNFIPDQDAWQLFEYLLIDRSLMDEAQLYNTIKAYIKSQLKEPALSQALAFLQQYQVYFEKIREEPVIIKNFTWEQKLDYLNSIRVDTFGEELTATLFGSEMMQNEMALAITRGEDTSNYPLGKHFKAQLKDKEKRENLNETIKMMRQSGFDEGQIWQTRAEVYGPEAADRWQILDAKRQEIAQQHKSYEQAKAQLGNGAKSLQQREQLIKQHFSGSEQRKMLIKERLSLDN